MNEMNTYIQQGCIKLIKSDRLSKDIIVKSRIQQNY